MSIEIKSGCYTASFGERLLNGLATPSIPGAAPAAGWYHIQPPVEDVVFGLVAIMSPTGGGPIASDDWTQSPKYFNPDRVGNKKYLKTPDDFNYMNSGIKFWDKTTSMAGKFFNQGTREEFLKYTSPGGSASAGPFVLSSCPIPGRNCLVIPGRFADLMDALTKAGGADVRVY